MFTVTWHSELGSSDNQQWVFLCVNPQRHRNTNKKVVILQEYIIILIIKRTFSGFLPPLSSFFYQHFLELLPGFSFTVVKHVGHVFHCISNFGEITDADYVLGIGRALWPIVVSYSSIDSDNSEARWTSSLQRHSKAPGPNFPSTYHCFFSIVTFSM